MSQATETLSKLQIIHRNDVDGGYAFVRDIVEYANFLTGRSKLELRNELLRLVAEKDEELWGVALESLVDGWKEAIGTELASLLETHQHSVEWESFIIMALLRVRYKPIARKAVAHISRRIAAGETSLIPMLAALAKVDVENCMKMLARFVVTMLNKGLTERLANCVPAIVIHFEDVSLTLLPTLVRRVSDLNWAAASQFANILCDRLDTPWKVKKLGSANIEQLKAEIRAALDRPL